MFIQLPIFNLPRFSWIDRYSLPHSLPPPHQNRLLLVSGRNPLQSIASRLKLADPSGNLDHTFIQTRVTMENRCSSKIENGT